MKANPGVLFQQIELDEDGIAVSSELFEARDKWEIYSKAVELNGQFILLLAAQQGRVIPKRGLSQEDINQLRDIIGRKLNILDGTIR